MKIVHVVSEFAPLAKVGGMGDVLLGLARATLEQNHDVTIIMPKYSTINIPCDKLEDFTYTYDNKTCPNTFWRAEYEGIPLILVETKTEHRFFQREHIYGELDDADRYAYFSKLVAAYLHAHAAPDVIHVHDWHTALVPLLYKKCRSVLTIHNIAYPGACGASTLQKIGLKEEELSLLRQNDHYSLLKGGILSADHITTVSPTYAREILTEEFGGPFCSVLNQNKEKLSGILNGIDYTYWNPQTDPLIPIQFNADSLERKVAMKQALQKSLSLPIKERMLVSAVARLVPQKGPELIETALRRTAEAGGQFILMGAASDEATRQQFSQLKGAFESNPNIYIHLEYDEALAHQVFAASDLLIVPSLFEPCGLTQMIAMRYGTVPLVRKTGGLADTVIDSQNGFVFGPSTKQALEGALLRSFQLWKREPTKWRKLIQNGMKQDWSWKKPAKAYLDLYASAQKSSPAVSS